MSISASIAIQKIGSQLATRKDERWDQQIAIKRKLKGIKLQMLLEIERERDVDMLKIPRHIKSKGICATKFYKKTR